MPHSSPIHYCTSHPPDWTNLRKKFTKEFFEKADKDDSGETLYIDTRWVILYTNDSEKVPVERVRDCHAALNIAFGGKNTDELNKVPNTTFAPFKPLIGIPNVQFLPLDSSTLSITYMKTNSYLDPENPVSDASQRSGIIDGVLNVYIGSTSGGGILGQAELNSNILYCLNDAVGGYNIKGPLSSYDSGKTVIHEFGHSVGLHHPFYDHVCDNQGPYTDLPEAINPNYNVELIEQKDGTFEQIKDNRYNDRTTGTNDSCLDVVPNPSSAPYEMGINFMDYAVDEFSIMFSKNQVQILRSYLQSDENTTLKLLDKDAVSISGNGEINYEDAKNDGKSSLKLENGILIAIITVSSLLFIIILIYAFKTYSARKKSNSNDSGAHKSLLAYQTIQI
jgi:hypothetical protein